MGVLVETKSWFPFPDDQREGNALGGDGESGPSVGSGLFGSSIIHLLAQIRHF